MCNCNCNNLTALSLGPKGDKGDVGPVGPSGSALVPVIDATSSSLPLTAPQTGSLVMLDKSGGVATTLPNNPPIGTNYNFQIATAPSTGNDTIVTSGGATYIGSITSQEAGATGVIYSAAGTSTITLNGGTTGGLSGTSLTLTYISSGVWNVAGNTVSSGTRATPFS